VTIPVAMALHARILAIPAKPAGAGKHEVGVVGFRLIHFGRRFLAVGERAKGNDDRPSRRAWLVWMP